MIGVKLRPLSLPPAQDRMAGARGATVSIRTASTTPAHLGQGRAPLAGQGFLCWREALILTRDPQGTKPEPRAGVHDRRGRKWPRAAGKSLDAPKELEIP